MKVLAFDEQILTNTDLDQVAEDAGQALDAAAAAQETAESILIYDHDYVISSGTATFTARVYKGGIDVHTDYDPAAFTWYLKTESGTTYLGAGYTQAVQISACGYGAEVIGYFTLSDDAEAQTVTRGTLQTAEEETLTVRAAGDSVRVRDLSQATTLYASTEVMVITAEDERLASLSQVGDLLWDSYSLEIEGQTVAKGNNTYDNLGLLAITNSELENMLTI